MKIKQGLAFKRKADKKKGRIGEQFDRDRWDDSRDPEWYVHIDGDVLALKIMPESIIKSTFSFE